MSGARPWRRALLAALALGAALLAAAPAHAHLMAAQKGTLNLVGDAAFLVLSVPVAALRGVDDDADGALSRAELSAHADAIRNQIQASVQLNQGTGAAPLQLVMLDVAAPDAAPAAPSRQLVVLGRFQLSSQDGSQPPLSLNFRLFGSAIAEQQQDLTITRGPQSQWLRFTPEQPAHALLPSAWAVLAEYIQTGAVHVLSGADHVLFLLVVLAGGWSLRGVVAALSCFTLGHALTLAACVWGGWSAPAAVVEPAIAATIVGMAVFDGRSRWLGRPSRTGLRLALVWGCALIHGLGLAGALSELTAWAPGSAPLVAALAGFNLGVEVAQLGVAAAAGALVWTLRGLVVPVAPVLAQRLAMVSAGLAGSWWFVERLTAWS